MVKGEEAAAAEGSAAAAAQRKRQRVSRACDQCYSKKDRCDGGHPVCSICLKVGRPCSYDRPERKRGPMSGVRQRLEAQVEILESVLGFILETFPDVGPETARQLDLDRHHNSTSADRDGSPTADLPAGDIFPRRSKQEFAKVVWKRSDLALCLRPSLGLRTGGIEDHVDQDEVHDQAQHALMRLRRAASSTQGPGMARRMFAGAPPSSSASTLRGPGAEPSSSYEVGQRQPYGMPSPSSFPFSDTRGGGDVPPPASQQPGSAAPPPHRMWELPDFGDRRHPQVLRTPSTDFGSSWTTGADRQAARPSPAGCLPQAVERDLDVYIDAYLSHAHPLYPFLDRVQLRAWADEAKALRSSHVASPGGARPSWVGDKSTTALLAALVALGCAGFAASIYPSQCDDPNANHSERERLAMLGRDCGRMALELLGDAVGASLPSGPTGPSFLSRSDPSVSLRLAQAMLLLALTDMCLGETLQAWTLLGIACRIAQANGFDGFNRPSRDQHPGEAGRGRNRAMTGTSQFGPTSSAGSAASPPSVAIGGSQRSGTERTELMTWWSAWCLEVFVSAALGRAPMADRSSFECPLPSPDGDLDEGCNMQLDGASVGGGRWEKARIVTAFVSQIHLMTIVAQQQRHRATDPAAPERFSQRLLAWASTLPPPLNSALQASLYDAGDPLLDFLPHFRHVVLLYHHARQLSRSHDAPTSALASLSILGGLSRSQGGAHRMPALSSCLAIAAERSLVSSAEPETTLHHARRIASDLCRSSALLWRPGLGHLRFSSPHAPSSSPVQAGKRPGGQTDWAYNPAQQHAPSMAPSSQPFEAHVAQDRRFAPFAAAASAPGPTEAELDDHAHALAYALGMTDAMPPANGSSATYVGGFAPSTSNLGMGGSGLQSGPGPSSSFEALEGPSGAAQGPRGSLSDANVAWLMADFGAAAVQAVQQQDRDFTNVGLNLSPRQTSIQGHSSVLHQLGLQVEAPRAPSRRPSFMALPTEAFYPAGGQGSSGEQRDGVDVGRVGVPEAKVAQGRPEPHNGASEGAGAYSQEQQHQRQDSEAPRGMGYPGGSFAQGGAGLQDVSQRMASDSRPGIQPVPERAATTQLLSPEQEQQQVPKGILNTPAPPGVGSGEGEEGDVGSLLDKWASRGDAWG